MTSNPAFTEKNVQKANAYLLYSHLEQKSLLTYHTLQSLYVCVWLVNNLTSTAPIGSPIISMWSPANIWEQWERIFSCSSADVRGAETRDEPLKTSTWEARWSNDFFMRCRQLRGRGTQKLTIAKCLRTHITKLANKSWELKWMLT